MSPPSSVPRRRAFWTRTDSTNERKVRDHQRPLSFLLERPLLLGPLRTRGPLQAQERTLGYRALLTSPMASARPIPQVCRHPSLQALEATGTPRQKGMGVALSHKAWEEPQGCREQQVRAGKEEEQADLRPLPPR